MAYRIQTGNKGDKVNKLSKIEIQINKMHSDNSKKLLELEDKARIEFKKLMHDKKEIIIKMQCMVEDSRELTQDPHDTYFTQWCSVDFSDLIDTNSDFQKELLSDYFQDECSFYVDFKNDVLNMSVGPAILINHEGDVLDQDSGKWFISRNDYESDDDRNTLIAQYMEKNGYFPTHFIEILK
jgi:hypothetical protein